MVRKILGFFDLAAIFAVMTVVLFLELSFVARLGLLIATGLLLAYQAGQRISKDEQLDGAVAILEDAGLVDSVE